MGRIWQCLLQVTSSDTSVKAAGASRSKITSKLQRSRFFPVACRRLSLKERPTSSKEDFWPVEVAMMLCVLSVGMKECAVYMI